MRRWTIWGSALALAGCLDFGPRAEPDAGAMDMTPPDAGLDRGAPDQAVDMSADAARDMAPDAAADMRMDAAPDMTPDASADLGVDAAPDMAPDAGPTGIERFSTDFDTPESIAGWATLGAESFTFLDAGRHHASRLTLRPALGGWHQTRTAGLLYVEIEGDFIVDADLVAGRIGDLALPPTESFNAAGLLVRDPMAGAEDWLLVGLGQLRGRLGIEGKSTVDGVSEQVVHDVDSNRATLRLCRRGPDVYLLYRQDGGWETAWHDGAALIQRPDLPARLQVGVFANGWNGVEDAPAVEGSPDLEAVVDAIRFRVPTEVADCTR